MYGVMMAIYFSQNMQAVFKPIRNICCVDGVDVGFILNVEGLTHVRTV